MPDYDTTAVLTHHLAQLDVGACAALVADLWAARGYETSHENERVVATGHGTTLYIHVGTPEDSAELPDVVVSPRGDRSTRAVAEAADARFLDATGIAGMLRYAVDRPTAVALCERHFGAPPEDLRPPPGERLRARIRRLQGIKAPRSTRSGIGTTPVFGLVLVLLFGAVAGVALTGTSGDGTDGAVGVEPLSIPESTPVGDTDVGTVTTTPGPGPSVVPGLTDDGISDLSALASAHARGVVGRSYTLWMDTYRPSRGFPDEGRVQFDTDVTVAGNRFLVEENVGEGEGRQRLRTVYYDGTEWYVAEETAEGPTYARVTQPTPSPTANPDAIAQTLVADYLSTPASSIEGRITGDRGVGEPTLYRVVGRGVPSPMAGDGVRNYTAVALVDRDGLVRDLTVTYTVDTGDESDQIRKEWTYGHLGATVVDPPVWYDEQFTANTTASPTAAD